MDAVGTSNETLTSPTSNLDAVKQTAITQLRRLWDFRRQYDQNRAELYRQYVGKRLAGKFPDGVTNRSNTHVPYALSNVETIVSRVSDAFFSFEPWFETSGATEFDDNAAEAMQLVLQKKLEQAKLKSAFESTVRTILIYGYGGCKVDWNWDTVELVKPVIKFAMDPVTGQPFIDPNTQQPVPIGTQMQMFTVPVARPRITPIDIYDLLVDPDGGLAAQMTERTIIEMLRENDNYQAKVGQPLYDPQVLGSIAQKLQEAHPDDWQLTIIRFAELWDSFQGTCTILTFGDDKDAIAWKDLRASYRSTSYSPYKRRIFEGRELLWHGPNQFAHKRNPIVATSYIKLPNEEYGLGAIETTSDLNESLNKMVNMVTDNWNLGINRRFAYDTNADIDHDALNLMNVPGGKVPVNGNPNDVIAPLPLFTPNNGDYAILDLYKGMIEMTSGVSDLNQSNMSTATALDTEVNERNFRFKMFIRNLEVDILQPLLAMCASMIQQFVTDNEEVLVTNGASPMIPKWVSISPDALIGNFDFNLVAANYTTSKTIRQRNLMSFAQLALPSPYANGGEFLREVGKVLEIRNINNLLKPDEQVQAEQAAAQQQQLQAALMQASVETESKVHVNTEKEKAKGRYDPRDGAPHVPDDKGHTVASHHHHGSVSGGPAQHGTEQGRPLSANLDHSTPGAGLTSPMKELGQNMGANAMGMAGMGEVNAPNG